MMGNSFSVDFYLEPILNKPISNQKFWNHLRKNSTFTSCRTDIAIQTLEMPGKENIQTYKKRYLTHDNQTKKKKDEVQMEL